ncbi:MAG TPA: RNA polymerase sigma-70 factor [Hymenobacter sp.]|jgi:RNA polymerase sigma-70 factor (ECF subfamily)|uniref:RNA polymerase sigma-70 factor n=1 Tax=Hymenobacter sp. TaxID=1898978 RepID=UPI002EDB79BA
MQPFTNRVAKHLRLYAAWDDAALVEGLRRGDERAFEETYRRHGFALLELAYRRTSSREAAEEIVQDLFTTLWHKRAVVDVQKLKEYLSTAVRYRVINLIRDKSIHNGYIAFSRAAASEADYHTEEDLAAADLSVALNSGLAHLPTHTREVFQLSRMEHRSVPEIAVRLKLSPKTVEYHLTRALKLLRVSLKDFLVPLVLLLMR